MCELCNLEKKTKWYYEDDEYIVCDCETCKTPMILAKKHGNRTIDEIEESYIYGLIAGIFGNKNFEFRKEQRKIKDHWHWHIIFDK